MCKVMNVKLKVKCLWGKIKELVKDARLARCFISEKDNVMIMSRVDLEKKMDIDFF